MAPKRKPLDATSSARLPKKRTPPSARVSTALPLEAPLPSTRRSARSTRAVVNYDLFDTQDLDDETVDTADSIHDEFVNSDDEQSTPSTAPSDLVMSSDHSSSEQPEYDGSDSDDEQHPKRIKTNKGSARSAAKSASKSTTDDPAKQKKSKSRLNMMNLNKDMKKEVDLTLPPLFGTQSIFEDLVAKALKQLPPNADEHVQRFSLKDVCKHVGSRPLRVATMCSGTESPLLAWNMISDCITNKESDLELEFEHVFSAEIVPYKQAYIERNFRPPIIFRDITQITGRTDGKATTAY